MPIYSLNSDLLSVLQAVRVGAPAQGQDRRNLTQMLCHAWVPVSASKTAHVRQAHS